LRFIKTVADDENALRFIKTVADDENALRFIKTEEVSRISVEDTYDAVFTYVVRDETGIIVSFGTIANKDSVTVADLVPGVYKVTISGDDIDDATKTVIVVAGAQVTVAFNDIPPVIGSEVKLQLADVIDLDAGLQLADVYLGSTDPEDPASILYGKYTPDRP
jgi:hypothetical protein